MAIKVGIPRALLYYRFYPFWKTFFNSLGIEVVVSGKTTKTILKEGLKYAPGEACLSVKVAFGHVEELISKVDYLFLPRLVSLERGTYICPKFMGFPDMIRSAFSNLPPLIDTSFNLRKRPSNLFFPMYRIGRIFKKSFFVIYGAYKKALEEESKYLSLLRKGNLLPEVLSGWEQKRTFRPSNPKGNLRVALVGHPYNLYDSFVNLNIIKKLKNLGAKVITPEMVAPSQIKRETDKIPQAIYWSLGREIVGASFYLLESKSINGLIHLGSFGCGPDSFLRELMVDKVRKYPDIAYLSLILDEHTGEAGMVTRLEAFIDLIQRRRKSSELGVRS
jgi:predicted nucleotide-binding protein (sugar kinase/HSP70/actin superfamily)